MSFLTQFSYFIFIGFCVVAALQLFYYLFYFSRLAFYRESSRSQSQTHPVSVIICAKDEAHNLIKYLPGALVQKYATSHEVIVVNDNSTDDTKFILEEFRRTFKHLQVIELKQKAKGIPGKKFPLSMGIKSARYEIVLLTDADCIPASDQWIQKMQEKYAEGIEIVLGYSPFQRKAGILNKLVRWEAFQTGMQYLSYARAGMPYMGVGRNLSYKKSVFLRNKGFSSFNFLPGGDDDLFINKVATKQNVAIATDPHTFTLTRPPATWAQWKSQKERHYSTSRHYKPVHKFLLGTYAISLFFYYPLFILSLLSFDWQIVLGVFGLRLIVQYIIVYLCAKKLHETDLAAWTILFDIWMFFYYLVFAGSLYRKPRDTWN